MRGTVELHDRAADLLEYPAAGRADGLIAAAGFVAREIPALVDALAPVVLAARGGESATLEESYAAAFDNNAACALEVGWHAFGENYTRGAFLVRMRERLRACGVPESTELPDHLSHVLRVLGRIDARDASLLSEAIVLPAVDKVLAALPAGSIWRGPLEAAASVLRTHLLEKEPAHA